MNLNPVTFPTWDEIKEENQKKIKERKYKGYSVDIPLCVSEEYGISLYMLIDCQNEQFIFKNYSGKKADNVIRFAICNKAGFAVASKTYVYSEEGYKTGIEYLKAAARYIGNILTGVDAEC